jgi:hypothetical protein
VSQPRYYRWTHDLLDAVACCIRRYGVKRTAAMLGLDPTTLTGALRRAGMSTVTLRVRQP